MHVIVNVTEDAKELSIQVNDKTALEVREIDRLVFHDARLTKRFSDDPGVLKRCRELMIEWEREANLLRSGNHQRRQGIPRRQVLQEECTYRGCIADLRKALGDSEELDLE